MFTLIGSEWLINLILITDSSDENIHYFRKILEKPHAEKRLVKFTGSSVLIWTT